MSVVVPESLVSPGLGLAGGLVLPGELAVPSVVLDAPVLPDLAPPSLVELSVLRSLMSAVTDCIVGESGPSSSITPALANAAPVNPAAVSGPAALHQLLVPTALCLATILLTRRV